MDWKKILILLFAILGSLSINGIVSADSVDEKNEEPKSGAWLKISPTTKRLSLKSGDYIEETITIANEGTESVESSIYVTPYSENEDGITKDFDISNNYNQISRWIKIKNTDGEFVDKAEYGLAPGEEKKVTFSISVPNEAPSGGQYACIFMESKRKEHIQGTIQAIPRVGSLVYAQIDGELKREAKLAGIEAKKFGNNIGVKANVANTGNIDIQATLDVKIESVFGEELYRHTGVTTILPESNKTIYVEWGETPAVGIFRVKHELKALNITENETRIVFVISPSILILTIAIIIAATIYLVFRIKTKAHRLATE